MERINIPSCLTTHVYQRYFTGKETYFNSHIISKENARILLHLLADCFEADLARNYMVTSGPGCSKLTTSLVNVSLKFQSFISNICQYFLLKKCEKLLQCKSFSHFFNKKYQCIWL